MMDESIFFFAFRDPNRIDFPVFCLDVHGVVVTLNTLDVVKASDIEEDEVADFFCNIDFCGFHNRIDIRVVQWTGRGYYSFALPGYWQDRRNRCCADRRWPQTRGRQVQFVVTGIEWFVM